MHMAKTSKTPVVHQTPGSPFLNRISLHSDRVQPGVHPFTIPLLNQKLDLKLTTPVTFLVGENGSGKSTLLEALAWALGFNAQGGNKDNSYAEGADGHALGRALALSWRQKVTDGFFLRAETFFNFATYLEEVGSSFRAYGGKSFHEQSHGEGFLALFENRMEDGVYLLDEPEAALSPGRQLTFLSILYQLASMKVAQFVIATHSPILLTLPGATIFSIEEGQLREVGYRETEHYKLTRDFLNAPERFHRALFRAENDPDEGE
ncbi:AAA family ATPase [Peristeroidobacter soli]|jgi:predicted ATPase|uniref:AAA family ATPase n=1 Tax=Peristeroidobacter soli TaxID=2497877 RepID=UPI001C379D39|nr:AAA family ATPase [Peristeroidobacter soli]